MTNMTIIYIKVIVIMSHTVEFSKFLVSLSETYRTI